MKNKVLLFSYGSLILSENLLKFNAKIVESAFIKGFDIEVNLSPITKRNYHYIQLVKGNNIIPGFIIETDMIDEIDKWEGNSYRREEIISYSRTLNDIKCYVYLKNI